MADYISITERINKIKNHDCFSEAKESDISYLKSLRLPDEVYSFYLENNPRNIIEINHIRLLPISEIQEENNNYTPGYILSPLGYCVIASTAYGDVYCVSFTDSQLTISLASHDEINEKTKDIKAKIIPITNSFADFLVRFIEGKLESDYYGLA